MTYDEDHDDDRRARALEYEDERNRAVVGDLVEPVEQLTLPTGDDEPARLFYDEALVAIAAVLREPEPERWGVLMLQDIAAIVARTGVDMEGASA